MVGGVLYGLDRMIVPHQEVVCFPSNIWRLGARHPSSWHAEGEKDRGGGAGCGDRRAAEWEGHTHLAKSTDPFFQNRLIRRGFF